MPHKSNHFISIKQALKCWDHFKKRLRDLYPKQSKNDDLDLNLDPDFVSRLRNKL